MFFKKKKEPSVRKAINCGFCQKLTPKYHAIEKDLRVKGTFGPIYFCSRECMTRYIIQDEKYKDEMINCAQCNNSFLRRDGEKSYSKDFCSSKCERNYQEEHHPFDNYQAWKP
ncbi:hypothetical protein ACQKD9_14660 [Bacillus paramycoides]|uniref:hypothetical protein n=1 Tax=Bacillus paramycoides TaxID=2026194 RepID=UPI003D01DAA2